MYQYIATGTVRGEDGSEKHWHLKSRTFASATQAKRDFNRSHFGDVASGLVVNLLTSCVEWEKNQGTQTFRRCP